MGVRTVTVSLPTANVTATKLLAALITETENSSKDLKLKLTSSTTSEINIDGVKYDNDFQAAQHLLSQTVATKTLMLPSKWQIIEFPTDPKDRSLMGKLGPLNKQLQYLPYIEGYRLALSDILQFVNLGNVVNFDISKLPGRNAFPHVFRWFDFMAGFKFVQDNLPKPTPSATNAPNAANAAPAAAAAAPPPLTEEEKFKEMEASFASRLPGAVKGQVVTRFPPEPSGYLHIGHAKAALLNSFYAKYFEGKLLIRFDDTNPSKEKAEFEQSIIEDLKLLGVEQVQHVSYTSDYMEQLQQACHKIITEGKAYVDNTPTEQMRAERFDGIESACRNLDVTENLRRWQEMLNGSEEGQTMCVRVKIDMKNPNKCMRDPVIYRTNVATPHHRTGTKYKAYPTYDFACPLVDSWSGVSHALRTNEYADRIPQYYFIQDLLGVRRTTVYEFSRLNFCNTVLSKRKLQWLVDTGVVDGWDDPRFPTVRGMRRRGLQIQTLHEFVIEQGPSKNTNMMEWDKLWSKNARVIDPVAVRCMAVSAEDPVLLDLSSSSDSSNNEQLQQTKSRKRPLHPKNPSLGETDLDFDSAVYIEREDAEAIEEGEEITLMRVGNVIVSKLHKGENGKLTRLEGKLHLDGDVKKTKKKIHWVAAVDQTKLIKFKLREYDHLITKKKPEDGDEMKDIVNANSVFDTWCYGEQYLKSLDKGTVLQLERRGFAIVDKVATDGNDDTVLIKIPDGRMKAMSVLSTKVDAASLMKGGVVGGTA